MTNSTLKRPLLLAVPIMVFAAVSLALSAMRGDYHFLLNFDPAFAYLFNGLNLLEGVSPAHVDHPGTPLQMLVAVVIAILREFDCLFALCQSPFDVVADNPQRILGTVNMILVAAASLSIFGASWRFYKRSERFGAAMAMCTSPLIFTMILMAMTNVSPEPLLVTAGFCVLTVMMPAFFPRPDDTQSVFTKAAVATGIGLGFGLAVKLTFFPFLLLPVLFRRPKRLVLCYLLCLTSFLLFTIPIWHKIPEMFAWIVSILTHTGRYGQGATGSIDIATAFSNLAVLRFHLPVFFLLLFIILPAAGIASRVRPIAQWASARTAIWLIIGGCLAQLIVTAKQPSGHYLVPSMVLLSIGTGFAVIFFTDIPRQPRLRMGVAVGIAVLLVFAGWRTINWSRHWPTSYIAQSQHILDRLRTDPSLAGCRLIGYFQSSLPAYSLSFGDRYAGFRHGDALRARYPGVYTYDVWSGRIHHFGQTIPREIIRRDLENGVCYLTLGIPLDNSAPLRNPRDLELTPLTLGDIEILARLDGVGVTSMNQHIETTQ